MQLSICQPNKYIVIPFGLVNRPMNFIQMMFNMTSKCQKPTKSKGVYIDEDTNTNIIVNTMFNQAKMLDLAFQYMECQFEVANRQHLSLSLPTSLFFPTRLDFIGVNIGIVGPSKVKVSAFRNMAKSKQYVCCG